MLRKMTLVSLAAVLVFAMVAVASAKQNVATTSTKGSLLVFPKIEVYAPGGIGTPPTIDTYIEIGNDQSAAVSVKCYWMDSNQTMEDFQFTMTANQPVMFSASQHAQTAFPIIDPGNIEVPPFRGIGSLVCFAVTDDGMNQLKWNHLYGNALIAIGVAGNPAVMYNAYAFAVPNAVSGTAGQLDLNGSATTGYDACPQYLLSNFYPAWSGDPWPLPPVATGGIVRPDLTLWSCKQDLRQDRTPTCTKAKFDVWTGNEVKYTGAYQCFKCFYEGFLDDLGADSTTAKRFQAPPKGYQRGPGFGWDKFVESALGTQMARFRVQGISSSVCDGKTRGCTDASGNTVNSQNTPLLGVLFYGVDLGLIDPINHAQIVEFGPGTPMIGAGIGDQASTGGPGFIKWDVGGSTPEAPAQ